MTEVGRLGGVEKYLRFQNGLATLIVDEKKTLTLRYGFERDLEVGDRVALVDEDDDIIEFADIDLAMEMTAGEFVRLNPDGHLTYPTVELLVDALDRLYPDAPEEFDADTVLDVFGWRVDP